jgi:phosphopantothenoylcysteine decarboxylase/phosphopantothenate--cysteine ligase
MPKPSKFRILITAGPTREFFDSVRFISNPSSGKMGYAIAERARRCGHPVTLISGPVSLADPYGVHVIRVTTAAEMFQAACDAFNDCDAAVLTAAVCDYRPARRLDRKLKKRHAPRAITLLPTADIAAHLGAIKGRRVVIGFAMEDHDHRRNAERKLKRKNCDAIVLNGPQNVGTDHAVVEVLRRDAGWSTPIRGSKLEIADRVIRLAQDLIDAGTTRS